MVLTRLFKCKLRVYSGPGACIYVSSQSCKAFINAILEIRKLRLRGNKALRLYGCLRRSWNAWPIRLTLNPFCLRHTTLHEAHPACDTGQTWSDFLGTSTAATWLPLGLDCLHFWPAMVGNSASGDVCAVLECWELSSHTLLGWLSSMPKLTFSVIQRVIQSDDDHYLGTVSDLLVKE